MAEAEDVRASITGMWEESRQLALDRVATIEDAVAALLAGTLPADARDAARREAHRLAGSLGTFGLPEGSLAARELEQALEREPAHADVPALAAHALALRRAVEAGPVEAAPDPAGGARVVLAGVPAERVAEIMAAARGTGWRLSTATQAPAPRQADVVLLGPEAPDPAAAVGALAGAGVAVAVAEDAMDRVEAVRAGARRLIPGDLEPAAVVAELGDLEQDRRARSATILAIDDDPMTLLLLQAALEGAGHRFVGVEDPLAFWPALASARPDLVILDVQLPGTDGPALCRALRADPRWQATPVLFLTATAEAERIGELFAAGGDDYVLKPVAPGELVGRIGGRLERTRRMQEAAKLDPLTGLARQETAGVRLRAMAGSAERLRRPLTVAAIRVDGLDGHGDGDPALGSAAAALRAALGPGDVAARWDGDELVVAMLGLDTHDARGRLGELLEAYRRQGPHTLSAGVAQLPDDGRDPDALVAAAIGARRRAEAAGGDRVAGVREPGEEDDRVDVALVEDDEVLARLVLHALQTRGYRTRWIADGDEACRLLGGQRPPLQADLVLLDWDLPARDGLTVLRLLAADGVLERTRVVMLTMRASEREALATLELGATDHIAKPFSVALLMQRVRRVLAR